MDPTPDASPVEPEVVDSDSSSGQQVPLPPPRVVLAAPEIRLHPAGIPHLADLDLDVVHVHTMRSGRMEVAIPREDRLITLVGKPVASFSSWEDHSAARFL